MCIRLGAALIKYVMFLANLVFALAGLAILGVGIAIRLQISEITNLLGPVFDTASTLVITLGAIVFVIAFFGCCGAAKESNCMLLFYSILMIILAVAKIVFVSLLLNNVKTLDSNVSQWLQDAFSNYSTNNATQISFNSLQTAFNCCGTTGPASYNNIPIPTSCCSSDVTQCNANTAYSQGCTEVLTDYLYTYANAVTGLIFTVVAIEIVAIVFGCCLAGRARGKDRRSRY